MTPLSGELWQAGTRPHEFKGFRVEWGLLRREHPLHRGSHDAKASHRVADGRFTLAGCGIAAFGFSGDLGATPGGAQDIGLARRKIADGIIPAKEDFVAEGLYSEHDLPLEGVPCDQVLCVRTATGIAPAIDTGRQEVFVQVGFSSNVDPATFRRKPLDVALVIDHSGSMSGEPMESVKEAARKLVEKLDENDTFSLVIFDDDVDTLVKQGPVKDRPALLRAIDSIEDDGGTCIECGLSVGFKQLATRPVDPERARRRFLFTDAMPNVGATGEGEFMTLLRDNSEQGRDTTVFGVNIAFGQELVTKMSAVRGSNYFYLSNAERTREVFDEDFDFLVTPIAYDLRMAITPVGGLRGGGGVRRAGRGSGSERGHAGAWPPCSCRGAGAPSSRG